MRRIIIVTGLAAAMALGLAPAAVAASSASSLAECGRVSEGDTGTCVSLLQEALNDTGAPYGLTEDGRFGAGTRIALLDFQGRNHLPADGIAGPETLALLEHVAAVSGNGAVASPQPGASEAQCGEGEVRYEGECYDAEYLAGESAWGGKPVVECADEATRKAVKKILDERSAADATKQGARQFGKKLLTVPGIFKCMLWDR